MIDIEKVKEALDLLDRQAYYAVPICSGDELFEAYTEVNQALKELERLQFEKLEELDYHQAARYGMQMHKILIETKIKEREKPMKAKVDDEHGYFTCPKCSVDWGYSTYAKEYNYCPNCGQKLDWSDEK